MQTANSFRSAKHQLCTCITLFGTYRCTRFVENFNIRQQFFFFDSSTGIQSLWTFRQILTNWKHWNSGSGVWNCVNLSDVFAVFSGVQKWMLTLKNYSFCKSFVVVVFRIDLTSVSSWMKCQTTTTKKTRTSKAIGFMSKKQQLCSCNTLFDIDCTSAMWNFLMWRFIQGANLKKKPEKLIRNFLFLLECGCCLKEFGNISGNTLHLTN